MTADVIELRRRLTPLGLVKRALEAGGDDPESGLLFLLDELDKNQVPSEIAGVWQQARILFAGLSVMCNEMCAALEEADPEVKKLLD